MFRGQRPFRPSGGSTLPAATVLPPSIVAFLGRLNPIGIVLAGLLLGLTYIGGELSQMMLQLPGAAIQVFQGMLLFFLLALDFQTNYRLRFTKGARA